MNEIVPFSISVSGAAQADLRVRLKRTQWPEQIPGIGWERGVPVAYLRRLTDYRRETYDCTRWQAELNRWPQYLLKSTGRRFIFCMSARRNRLHVR
jgi:epoxide hydrolase